MNTPRFGAQATAAPCLGCVVPCWLLLLGGNTTTTVDGAPILLGPTTYALPSSPMTVAPPATSDHENVLGTGGGYAIEVARPTGVTFPFESNNQASAMSPSCVACVSCTSANDCTFGWPFTVVPAAPSNSKSYAAIGGSVDEPE